MMGTLEREMLAEGRAIQRAAKELPEGWGLVISIERGSGSVVLYDPNGDDQQIDIDGVLSDAIEDAIEVAIDEAAKQAKKGGAV